MGVLTSKKQKIQYLVLPYARLRPHDKDGLASSFEIGPFTLWRDTPDNWSRYLGATRPMQTLSIYRDKEGHSLKEIWIGTPNMRKIVTADRWRDLVSALFYLCYVRLSHPAYFQIYSDDFYFESFEAPYGARDSQGHVRHTKYNMGWDLDLKIYPSVEVTLQEHHFNLPGARTIGAYDPLCIELFQALSKLLQRSRSNTLRALGFFFQSKFKSVTRASFAEDIQNICTAFESLVGTTRKGDTADQVTLALCSLFRHTEPFITRKSQGKEDLDVLRRLEDWTRRLYAIRNSYTHGKKVTSYEFEGRSVWKDAFEVFRLAANRKLLRKPEPRPLLGQATALASLLMSDKYLHQFVHRFQNGRKVYAAFRASAQERRKIRSVVDHTNAVDRQQLQVFPSCSKLEQALYGLSCFIYLGIRNSRPRLHEAAIRRGEFLSAMDKAYQNASASGSLKRREYVSQVAATMTQGEPGVPFIGSILVRQLQNIFGAFYELYGELRCG